MLILDKKYDAAIKRSHGMKKGMKEGDCDLNSNHVDVTTKTIIHR